MINLNKYNIENILHIHEYDCTGTYRIHTSIKLLRYEYKSKEYISVSFTIVEICTLRRKNKFKYCKSW